MALDGKRRAALLAYCKLTELADDPETAVTLAGLYEAAEGYMARAGVSQPPPDTPRRAQYDLCVNYLVLDGWDRRDMTLSGPVTENPAFRSQLNQLIWTEGIEDGT